MGGGKTAPGHHLCFDDAVSLQTGQLTPGFYTRWLQLVERCMNGGSKGVVKWGMGKYVLEGSRGL